MTITRPRSSRRVKGSIVAVGPPPAGILSAVKIARAVEAPVAVAIIPGIARVGSAVAVPAVAVPMGAGRSRRERGGAERGHGNKGEDGFSQHCGSPSDKDVRSTSMSGYGDPRARVSASNLVDL